MFVSTQERRIKTTGTPGTSLKYHYVNNGCDSISETIFFSCGVMCFDVYQSQGQRGSATCVAVDSVKSFDDLFLRMMIESVQKCVYNQQRSRTLSNNNFERL